MRHSDSRQLILERRLASIAEAAVYTGCSDRTIRRRISDGTLVGYRFGTRSIRVDLNDLDDALSPIPTVDRAS